MVGNKDDRALSSSNFCVLLPILHFNQDEHNQTTDIYMPTMV